MLLPHISSPTAADDIRAYGKEMDHTADRLANYYAIAVQRLEETK